MEKLNLIDLALIYVAGIVTTFAVVAFLKKTISTKYITSQDLNAKCSGCNRDMKVLKDEIVQATTEERRAEMKRFKDDVHDKLSKIMGVLLIIALKKEGEALSQDDRDKVIALITGQAHQQ